MNARILSPYIWLLCIYALHAQDAAVLSLAKYPQLADYTAFYAAQSAFDQKDYPSVERRLKPIWDHAPKSPLIGKAAALLANAYLEQNEPKKAQAAVERYRANMRGPEAEVLLAKATSDPAHLQRLVTDFTQSPEAKDAIAADPKLLATLSPKAHLVRALNLPFAQARPDLQAAAAGLTGPDLDLARVRLASDSNPALRALTVAPGEIDAERLYYLSRTGATTEALARLQQAYPKSPWRLRALLRAGDALFLQNEPSTYGPLYTACADAFPADPRAAICQWRAAWAAYRARRPDAKTLFEALPTRYPGSELVPNALYFLGRIAESANDPATARAYYDEVIQSYPNFFYATQARERTQILKSTTPNARVSSFLQMQPWRTAAKPEAFNASPASRARAERARLLADAGLDDLADAEIRFGARTEGQPEVAALELAEIANRRNAPNLAIRAIKQLTPNYLRLPPSAAPDQFWKLAFPFPFRGAVEKYAKALNLDPYLIAALIRQESEFDPKIVSHANAYGLTQLLPSTAREIARKLQLPFQTDHLFRPDLNVQIGATFLKSLFDRLGGKWEQTLAAYNAGPGRVAKWQQWGEFREPAEFIETIPFDETRNYVQSILRNADLYRRLYAAKPVALASNDGDIGRKDAR